MHLILLGVTGVAASLVPQAASYLAEIFLDCFQNKLFRKVGLRRVIHSFIHRYVLIVFYYA